VRRVLSSILPVTVVLAVIVVVALLWARSPGFDAAGYRVSNWRLIASTSATREALHLNALEHVAGKETSRHQFDAQWRQAVASCCNSDATTYATFLARQGLTHAEYLSLVRTWYYFSRLDDGQWNKLDSRYNAPLHDWFRGLRKPLGRRFTTVS
jgi:hypothetical protein